MGPLASPSAAEPAPTEGPAWLGGAAVSSGDIGTGAPCRGCCNCLLQLRRRQTGTEVKRQTFLRRASYVPYFVRRGLGDFLKI